MTSMPKNIAGLISSHGLAADLRSEVVVSATPEAVSRAMRATNHTDEILKLIEADRLGEVLRGETCVFSTPAEINDDMRPTDHDELLAKGIYPLVDEHGSDFITVSLENALAAICRDAMGVYCAIQCFYMEILTEDQNRSP